MLDRQTDRQTGDKRRVVVYRKSVRIHNVCRKRDYIQRKSIYITEKVCKKAFM